MNFQYYMPTKLIFGAGAIKKLKRVPFPGERALIVIGASGAMRSSGYLDMVIELLEGRGVRSVVYDRILPNPISDHVDEGACIAREKGCDFILGLGGGSTIDSAKSIALMVNNDGAYWDYISGGTGGGRKASGRGRALPIVAIPTTAGTGTEVDPWTVITKADTHEKIGWGRDDLFPTLAIVDPRLMVSVPPKLTAYTGMDSFFHAAEAYLSKARQPSSDMFAIEAIRLISENLPKAVHDGSDIEARTKLAWASTAAGMCETLSSCISQHSMEHALSAFHPDLPHGAGLTLLSKEYFSFMADAVSDRFTSMARAMGGVSFVSALERLIDDVGLSSEKLSHYGVSPDEFPGLAENALTTMGALFMMTPVNMEKEHVISIYEKAYT
jgi:alcohol dehydrogenase